MKVVCLAALLNYMYFALKFCKLNLVFNNLKVECLQLINILNYIKYIFVLFKMFNLDLTMIKSKFVLFMNMNRTTAANLTKS